MKKPITECPHCGSTQGYYRKVYMKGWSQYNHTFDGSEAHNEELHTGLNYRETKATYCIKCDKKINITPHKAECGNCGRPATVSLGDGMNRCDRCSNEHI